MPLLPDSVGKNNELTYDSLLKHPPHLGQILTLVSLVEDDEKKSLLSVELSSSALQNLLGKNVVILSAKRVRSAPGMGSN